jgi:hypothetical protein
MAITITGTGANTKTVSGNTHTIQFTGGTNTISINVDCTLYVIAVGGGGSGGNAANGMGGGGGGGGGYGVWTFDYTANTSYTVFVGNSAGNSAGITSAGANTTFITMTSGIGIIATGGAVGAMATINTSNTTTANGGTCTLDTNAPGTLISKNGGNGAGVTSQGYAGYGTNSDGIITVLGIDYIYGGGGSSGTNFYNGDNLYGGLPGKDGIGATSVSTSQSAGTAATTIGSGGGGGNANIVTERKYGGGGMKGIVIVTFVY